MPRILVVDDDLGVRTAMKVLLEFEHYDVTLAEDGRAALQLLEGQSYDLVMVDASMPGMDGFETVRELRMLRPQMPIIVMSGGEAPPGSERSLNVRAMAAKVGADHSLRKPFGSRELLRSVQSCLDRANPSSGHQLG